MALHHARDRNDQCRAAGVLPALDLGQLAIPFFTPEPDLSPARDAHQIMLPERNGGAPVGMHNIRVPPTTHVMDHIEFKSPQALLERRSAFQSRPRHLHGMNGDPKVASCRMKLEADDMHLVAMYNEPAGELPRPVLQPAFVRIESLEHQADVHAAKCE